MVKYKSQRACKLTDDTSCVYFHSIEGCICSNRGDKCDPHCFFNSPNHEKFEEACIDLLEHSRRSKITDGSYPDSSDTVEIRF